MTYAITATVVKSTPDGYSRTIQVPTFYLDSGVLGIMSEAHARTIALDIINPTKDGTITVYAHALAV